MGKTDQKGLAWKICTKQSALMHLRIFNSAQLTLGLMAQGLINN